MDEGDYTMVFDLAYSDLTSTVFGPTVLGIPLFIAVGVTGGFVCALLYGLVSKLTGDADLRGKFSQTKRKSF